MSEIYESFRIKTIDFPGAISSDKIKILNILNILCKTLGTITIISISIVFVAIRKRSKILYALFYIASLIEVVIILYRLWIFCEDYFIYYEIMILNTYNTNCNYNF